MNCGSGFCLRPDLAGPAANRFVTGGADRGWPATSYPRRALGQSLSKAVESKAAPTIRPTTKIQDGFRLRG